MYFYTVADKVALAIKRNHTLVDDVSMIPFYF